MSAATQKANEPSMEEILASIRRIIADDSSAPPPPPEEDVPASAGSAEAEDLDVLDLATVPEAVTAAVPPVDLEPLPQSVEMDEDIEFRFIEEEQEQPPPALLKVKAPEKAPEPPPPPPAFEMPLPEPEPAQPLIADEVGAHVSSSFQFLATTLVPQNGRTLEDIVKDMMRPMLKSWLDQHLPGLVERLVKAEIERVTRGPR